MRPLYLLNYKHMLPSSHLISVHLNSYASLINVTSDNTLFFPWLSPTKREALLTQNKHHCRRFKPIKCVPEQAWVYVDHWMSSAPFRRIIFPCVRYIVHFYHIHVDALMNSDTPLRKWLNPAGRKKKAGRGILGPARFCFSSRGTGIVGQLPRCTEAKKQST